MVCPYICNIVQINQIRYEYDESGNNNFHEHILKETKKPIKCREAQCAAWQNGRCMYRGD